MDDPNFVDAFNAYSRNGTASGLPVYVNFGQIEDFEVLQCYLCLMHICNFGPGRVYQIFSFQYLRDNYGIGFTADKICMARYGRIFRYFLTKKR